MRVTRRSSLARLAWLVLVWLMLLIPWTPLRAVAFVVFIGAGIPTAWLAARVTQSHIGRLAIAGNLGPALVSAATILLLATGAPTTTAPWIVLVLASMVFLTMAPADSPKPPSRPLLVGIAVVATLAAVLALSLPLTQTWWRVREDSWFHVAVVRRLGSHGLPLLDPYFTPLRLQYMYAYHTLLLVVERVTGVGPFHAIIVVNAIALFNVTMAVGWLAGAFTRRVSARVLAVALAVFGMNGLFYLFFPIRLVRAFLGETRGIDQIRHFFALTPPGHETAQAWLSVEANQFLFLDKFILGTAVSLATGLIAVCVAMLMRRDNMAGRRPGARVGMGPVVYGIAAAGLLMFHPVIGAAVVAAGAGAVVADAVWRRLRVRSADTVAKGGAWIPFIVASAAAVIVVLPYLRTVIPVGGTGGTARLAWQWHHAVGLFAAILPALVWCAPLMPRGAVATGSTAIPAPQRDMFLWWLAFAGLLSLFVDLVTVNETKFTFVLFIPLAAAAAAGIERVWQAPRGRAWVAFILAASILPLNVVYFANAWQDPTRHEVSADEQRLYEWIQEETARKAVFIESNDRVRIPVLAGRDQYWGTEVYARNWAYDTAEIARRRRVRDRIFSGTPLRTEDRRALAALERPVYVVCHLRTEDGRSAAQTLAGDAHWKRAFESSSIEVYTRSVW